MKKFLILTALFIAMQTVSFACNDCGGILYAEPDKITFVQNQYRENSVSMFSGNSLPLNEYMRQEILNHTDKIDLTDYKIRLADTYDIEEIKKSTGNFVNSFIALNGDLPIAISSYNFSYTGLYSGNNTIYYLSSLELPYIYDTIDEQREKVAALNELIDETVRYAERADSTVGKILLAHDKIAYDYSYKSKDSLSHTAYSFLERGTGVCQGYAYFYQQVLSRLGITSGIYVSYEANHMWSCITLGGQTYHSDVTWDDPIVPSSWSDQRKKEYTNHDYFLFTDEYAQKKNKSGEPEHGSKSDWEIYGYDDLPDCIDSGYMSGFIFTDSKSRICYENGEFIFKINGVQFTKKSIKSSGAYITSLTYDKSSGKCSLYINIPASFTGISRPAVAVYDDSGKLTEFAAAKGKTTSSLYTFTLKNLHEGGSIKAMNLSEDLISPLSETKEIFIQ